MQIEKASAQDIEQISNLNKQCFPSTFENYSREILEAFLQSTFIIRDLKIVAYIILGSIPTNNDIVIKLYNRVHNNRHMHNAIISIAVAEEYRRKGLASKLIQFAQKSFAKVPLFLQVRMHNLSARNLYKKLNFISVDTDMTMYKEPEDAGIIMVYHSDLTRTKVNRIIFLNVHTNAP